MKFFLLSLLLALPLRADVCVVYGLDANGISVSNGAEIYCTDAQGSAVPITYLGGLSSDGEFINFVTGKGYYVGRTPLDFADLFLQYAVNTNQ